MRTLATQKRKKEVVIVPEIASNEDEELAVDPERPPAEDLDADLKAASSMEPEVLDGDVIVPQADDDPHTPSLHRAKNFQTPPRDGHQFWLRTGRLSANMTALQALEAWKTMSETERQMYKDAARDERATFEQKRSEDFSATSVAE